MKKRINLTTQGNVLPISLLASAVVGLIAVMSFIALPDSIDVVADMRLEPVVKTIAIDETFVVDVVVESTVPVNVFAGDLTFNTDTLKVESISYNTSIADLWAEEPWYSNGDGTLNFIGGTTKQGGFIGTDTLLTITFKALTEGSGTLVIKDATILQHDGLGSNASLKKPIDALFTVAPQEQKADTNLLISSRPGSAYQVVTTPPSPDLNGDGKQSIADTSILLLNLGSSDMRYDLNQDGSVNLSDLNFLLRG